MTKAQQRKVVDEYLGVAQEQTEVLIQIRNLIAQAKGLGKRASRLQRKLDDYVQDGMVQAVDPDLVDEAIFKRIRRWNWADERDDLYDAIDELEDDD